ncbi:CPBP family glutamic-type intramembrane protease [Pontibacter ramchanderi]|uniref:CAAX prenyl protease-like protein n=1 Tax=Pontibacter ramchanderi TaxID=1179743 RepID=A0A2N3U8Q3_9BACT|nr:CPBP family glutamic-type intramembrane protease [Pontibacter ramchanderi]PKV63130.1 CAAX prenyl protease-like protein [Pontibacter ramchanderi]
MEATIPTEQVEINPPLRETVLAFWHFLKAPQPLQPQLLEPKQVWRPLLQLFALKFSLSVGITLVIFGLLSLLGFDHFGSHRLEVFLQETHPLLVLLAVAVVGPAIEEFFFRAPLRYTRKRLIVSFLTINIFVLPPLLEMSRISTLVSALVWLTTLALGIWVVLSDDRAEYMRQVWEKRFGAVFYTFTVVFALVHLANYENLNLPAALIPLLVVPQFIGALFWSYMRLRFGLTWAILAHGTSNALLLALTYLTT